MINRRAIVKTPKSALTAAILLATALAAAPAQANAVVTQVGCTDYAILASPNGYALVQWMAGKPLMKDDTVTNDIATVGPQNAILTTGQMTRFYVEDAGMNSAAATQMLTTRCSVKPLRFPF